MFLLIILAIFANFFLTVSSENVRERLFMNGPCFNHEYRCSNNKCIEREKLCNRVDDCGDNSDERYCRYNLDSYQRSYSSISCPTNYPFFMCVGSTMKCIPAVWKCDGIHDCDSLEDERNCNLGNIMDALSSSHVSKARREARKYIISQRNGRNIEKKWGLEISRKTIALFMNNITVSGISENFTSEITNEIPYELSNSLLSRLALKKMKDVSTSELAHYVNALLVSCINPKRFHVVDLVKELRKRVDARSTANPYAYLALCNAKEYITDNDVSKLTTAFQSANSKIQTDTQALIIMALACAANQPQSSSTYEDVSELTQEIKKRQYRNGTVENIKTTALVLQALYASESEPDSDNFDEEKALKQILRSQEPDGSFGNFLTTYYVIPILSYSSLVNISNAQCPSVPKDDSENEVLDYLRNQLGEKVSVTYSFWIGDDKLLQRSMTLKVPANTFFYTVMEYAAELDHKYKFECNVRNRKPYVYALSGIMDDAEAEMFWQLFHLTTNSSEPSLIDKSPSDVILENDDHLVYWYKKGT